MKTLWGYLVLYWPFLLAWVAVVWYVFWGEKWLDKREKN